MGNTVTIIPNSPQIGALSNSVVSVQRPTNSTVTSTVPAVKITIGPTPPQNPSYGDLWVQIL